METVHLEIEIPTDLLSILRKSKKEMEMEAKLAMALQLFKERRISAGKASELSGLPLADFMEATRLHAIEWVDYTDEELEAEIRESVQLGQNLR